jgi:hypothetical protein
MDEAKRLALMRHLTYEIDMFENSFNALVEGGFTDDRVVWFRMNSAIECFWIHARNLLEFLTHPRNATPTGIVSAQDFTDGYRFDFKMKQIDTLINEQIAHLKYERKATSEEQLGSAEVWRVKETIDREVREFERTLLPGARSLWTRREVKYRRAWPGQQSTSTAATTYGVVTGPTGPSKPPKGQ